MHSYAKRGGLDLSFLTPLGHFAHLVLVRPKASVTIRDDLNRRKRKSQISALIGLAVLILGATLGSRYRAFWIPAVFGFALFLGGTLYQLLGIRCPRCQSQLDL